MISGGTIISVLKNASSKTNPDSSTTALIKLQLNTVSGHCMCSKRSTEPYPVQLHAEFKQVLCLRQIIQQLLAVLTVTLARKEQSPLSLEERQFGNLPPSPLASGRTLLLPPHLARVHQPSHHTFSVLSPINFQQNKMDSGEIFSHLME